jgi:hypothetical protein
MLGFFEVGGLPPYTGANGSGMYALASTDTTAGHTALWQMGNANQDAVYPTTDTAFAGCFATGTNKGLVSSNIAVSTKTDLARIPTKDMYGNVHTGTAYTNSHIVDTAGHVKSVYDGSHNLDQTQVTNDYHWGLAMWNGVDNAAMRIRTDANLANRPGDTQNMAIAIYTIGYLGNAGGTDDGLLKRVANDKSANGYNGTQPTGRYIAASDTAQLAAAFDTMASIILRLSQ